MKLEFKLKNPKYCNGCPKLFGGIVENFTDCWYYNIKLKLKNYRNQYSWIFKVIRPQRCIKENGE